MNIARPIALVLGLFFSLASLTGPDDNIPATDSCEGGLDTGALTAELGKSGGLGFEILDDDDVVRFVTGSQGSNMLPLRYRITGTELSCASVVVEVFRCTPKGAMCTSDDPSAESLTLRRRDLRMYADEGAMVSRPDFVIVEAEIGDRIVVELEVAGAKTTRTLWYEEVGIEPADAGTDAPGPNSDAGGPGPPDGGFPDASL